MNDGARTRDNRNHKAVYFLLISIIYYNKTATDCKIHGVLNQTLIFQLQQVKIMSNELKSGYCRQCEKNNVVFRPGTNHILHLLLSVVTVGIWLPFWLLQSIRIGGWRCQVCGSNRVKDVV